MTVEAFSGGGQIGDAMPRIILNARNGKPVDTVDQFIAGNTMVFWIVTGAPPSDRLADFMLMADAFRAVEVKALVVAGRWPDTGEADAGDNVIQLHDPEGRLARSFGFADSGVVVCNPRGKIVSVQSGDAFAGAIEMATNIHASDQPAVRRRTAPVLIVPDILEPSLCTAMIAYWERSTKSEDAVAVSRESPDAMRNDIKRRADVFLQDRSLIEVLHKRVANRLIPEISRAFHFDVVSMEPPRIGCYDGQSGGYFRRHRDNRTHFTAHRGFAMTLNLNTGNYAGGQLRFPEFGRELFEPEAGGAIIFCCNLLHEALPVTSGRRFALVSFFADASGAAQEQKLIAAEKAAGRRGVVIGP